MKHYIYLTEQISTLYYFPEILQISKLDNFFSRDKTLTKHTLNQSPIYKVNISQKSAPAKSGIGRNAATKLSYFIYKKRDQEKS